MLADALAVVLRLASAPALTVAGRTDAGVHARGQVCHVDVAADTATDALVRRLAGTLPRDLRVRRASVAPPGFDARFSAQWRRYAYRVSDAAWGVDPLRRHDVLGHRGALDLTAMNEAASGLLGEHDFLAYCRPRPGATTVRVLRRLDWARAEGGLAVATVVADAFCHRMVRALAGALLSVGDGRRPVSWPAQVLAAAVRDPRVEVLPPHGLTLEEVAYPPDLGS